MQKFSSTIAMLLGGCGVLLSGRIAKLQVTASGAFAEQLEAYQLLCILGTFTIGAGAWFSMKKSQDTNWANAIAPFALSVAAVGSAAIAIKYLLD